MKDIGRRFSYRKILKNTEGSEKTPKISIYNKVRKYDRFFAGIMVVALIVQLFAFMPSASAMFSFGGRSNVSIRSFDDFEAFAEFILDEPPAEPVPQQPQPEPPSTPVDTNKDKEEITSNPDDPSENNSESTDNTAFDDPQDKDSDTLNTPNDEINEPAENNDPGNNNDSASNQANINNDENNDPESEDPLDENNILATSLSIELDELMLDITAASNPLPAGTNFHGAVSINMGQYVFTRNGSTVTGGETGTLAQWNAANLRVEYNSFTINAVQLKAILDTNNAAGLPVEFIVPRPAGLVWDVDITTQPLAIIGGPLDKQVFAYLSVAKNGEATIRFSGDFWNENIDLITDIDGGGFINAGHLYIEVSLNDSTNKTNGNHEIQLYGKTSMTIKVNDFVPTPASINKTGRYNHHGLGELEWTLTYNPGSPAASTIYPVVITDTLGPGQVLDPLTDNIVLTDGANINVSGTSIEGLVRNGTTGFTLTIPHDSAYAGKPITITYRSYPNQDQIGDGNAKSFTNNATVTHNGTNVGTAAHTITIPADQNRWIYKAGTQVGRDIEWTVTISTLSQNLRNLVFHDTMGSALSLVDTSITINGTPASPTTKSGNSFTIDLSTHYSNSFPGTITIKYRTTVNGSYFDNPGQTPASGAFGNSAHLTFEWEWRGGGINIWHNITSPTMTRNPGVNRDIIKKTARATNPVNVAEHLITWRIDVNPYNVYIQDGTITDIPNPGGTSAVHELVNDPAPYGPAFDNGYISFDPNTQKFTVTGTLEANSTHFYVTTKATDSQLYGGNTTNTTYTNRAEFDGNVRLGGSSGTPTKMTDSANADVLYTSRVLNKTAISHSRVNDQLVVTWEITVNQNRMELESPILTDTLSAGLSFVEGSIVVRPGSQGTVSATVDGQSISFTHSEGFNKQQVVFRYNTAVDVNALAFDRNANVTVKNSAELVHSGHTGVTASAERVIHNRLLQKSGSLNDGVISYSVNINPYGLNLDAANMGRTVTDTFPLTPTVGGLPPLVLNPQSLQLWEATLTATSTSGHTLSKSSNVTNAATIIYQTDGPGSVITGFSIILPKADQAYILEYQCSVRGTIDSGQTFNGNINNAISFNGSAAYQTSTSDSTHIGTSGGSGTGGFAATLTLRKVDSERTSQGIAGVEFRAYQNLGGSEFEIVRGLTDVNGYVRLRLPPAGTDTEYIIREYSVDGYISNSLKLLNGNGNPTFTSGASATDYNVRLISGNTIGASFSRHGGYTLTVTNDPVTGNLSFTKLSQRTDGNGSTPYTTPLESAEFKLADKTGAFSLTAVSGPDGKVTFSDIPFGEYDLIETVTPNNHFAPAGTIDVTIDKTGTITKFGSTTAPASMSNLEVINIYSEIMLTVYSFDTSKQNKILEEAIFELLRFENGQWITEGKKITDSSGYVEFYGLRSDTSYKIIAGSPVGYYQTDSEYTFTTDSDLKADYFLDWVFHLQGGKITINKTEHVLTGPNIPMQGVWFDLYKIMSNDENDDILLNSAASDSTGTVIFDSIPLSFKGAAASDISADPKNPASPPIMDTSLDLDNTLYRIVERWFPGYYPTYPKIKDTLTPADQEHEIEWINYPGEGEITLTVLDSETGEPLSGVTFALYGPFSGVSTRMGTATTDEFGMLSFLSLPLGSGIDDNIAMAMYDAEPIKENGASITFTKKQLGDLDGYEPLSAPIITTLSLITPIVEVEAELDPIPNGNGYPDDNQNTDPNNNINNNQNNNTGNNQNNTNTPGDNNDNSHNKNTGNNDSMVLGSTESNTTGSNSNRNITLVLNDESMPRTGVESITGMLFTGLITSLAMCAAVFIVIKHQSNKEKRKFI